MQAWLTFGGQLAWPVAALIIMFVLLREIKNGIISKIVPADGTLKYGDISITRVSAEIAAGQKAIETADVPLQTPNYAQHAQIVTEEELTPYEMVMTSYSGLAAAVAALAAEHGGADDQRYVWDNIELLLRRGIIDGPLFGAIRASQMARNSIRRLGPEAVTEDKARTYAETAYSAEQALRSKLEAC